MKDQAERAAAAATNAGNSMPNLGAVDAPAALPGTFADRKDRCTTLLKSDDFSPRLHAGTLFDEDKFTTVKVDARAVEHDHCLQREVDWPVEILMQAVVVAGAIAEQQWRRPALSRSMAAREQFSVLRRPVAGHPQHCRPAVRNAGKLWVERIAEAGDRSWRNGEVPILTAPEAVPRHLDGRTEQTVVVEQRRQCRACVRRQERRRDRIATIIEASFKLAPADGIDAGHRRSPAMSARFREMPHL